MVLFPKCGPMKSTSTVKTSEFSMKVNYVSTREYRSGYSR